MTKHDTIKTMKLTAPALVLLSCLLYSPMFNNNLLNEFTNKNFWDYILHNLSAKESGHDDHAVSSKGAKTRYQIMPSVLFWYNHTEKKDYSIKYLIKFPDAAKAVSLRALKWNFGYFIKDYDKPYLRIIKTISAYNTGFKIAKRNVIKYVYVRDIFPLAMERVERENNIIWKGKKYLKIK